ncbi:hypothetical protein X759_21165 [Mesorhizobium sp. LSHC420B00]|nr:hypothetical protein X759_21165 [Mesorhizobium sp. LSHC420B00]
MGAPPAGMVIRNVRWANVHSGEIILAKTTTSRLGGREIAAA